MAARGSGDAPTDVSEESATSNEATPMAEAPANPTPAQEAEQEAQGTAVPDEGPSEEAIKQVREDQQKRNEEPNKPVTREANPAVGGESFSYLQH